MTEEVFVTIPQGTLKGRKGPAVLGNVFYGFLGIPYAEPPVGPLRFKAPKPAKGWTGVRDATKSGNVFASSVPMSNCFVDGSDEDALVLNVYSREPPSSGASRPVMVFFHGGGFTDGTGNFEMHGPDYLVLHDIVLVTVNYRLGALGFLSLQTPECPGNFGLKDQRLALQWIQQNISFFGGDPDNVTISGESAGAASVHYLLLSPTTKGLFKRGIAMSGSALNYWAYSNNPRGCAFELGKRLGCDTEDDAVLLDFLSKAPFRDIVEKSYKVVFDVEGEAPGEKLLCFSFTPTAEPESEDAFITKHPSVLIKEGQYQDVPLLAGICSQEMLFAVDEVDVPQWTRTEEFQALLPKELKFDNGSESSLKAAKKIKEFYFKDGVDFYSFVSVLSATFFVHGIYRTVKSHVANEKTRSPHYLYHFSYDSNRGFLKLLRNLQTLKDTTHAEELGYLFEIREIPLPPLVHGTKEYEVMLQLTKIWTNFAKTGELPSTWPPIDAENFNYMEIGEKLKVKEGFRKEEMQLWEEIYNLAGN